MQMRLKPPDLHTFGFRHGESVTSDCKSDFVPIWIYFNIVYMYVCLSVYLLLLVYDRRRAQTGTDFESNWHLKFFETNCKKIVAVKEKKNLHIN